MKFQNELHPNRLSAAADAGFRVFPVLPREKRPAVAWTEFVERPPSDEEIQAWGASNYNVGIICGDTSGGIVVLDVDSEDAQALVDGLGLPVTPVASTGRGKHHFFKAPMARIRNSVHIGGQKLDVRGNGGYVVDAGSIHPTGARYEWLVWPSDAPFAEFLTQLLGIIEKGKPTKTAGRQMPPSGDVAHASPPAGVDRFLGELLNQSLDDIEGAAEGERNDTLFRKAVSLARHCAGARVDWGVYTPILANSAALVGLDDEEVAATLESAWAAGSAEPTQWLRIASEHV